jgi:glycosyltransferase involved in cell wall biosynthesis
MIQYIDMNKIKNEAILYIGPDSDKGGIGSVLKIYEKYMPESKFIGTYPKTSNTSKYFFFCQSIYKIIKTLANETEIKIIHIHSASKGSFFRKSIICLIGKMFHKKTILHIHGGSFKEFYNKGLNKYYINFIFRINDKTICLSEEWKLFFDNIMRKDKIKVLGNPVEDYKKYRINTENISHKIKMLFLGNISEEKGIFELINFLNENEYFKNNVISLVIGGIGNEKILGELINNNKNIQYAGWINADERIKYLKECNLFILPSFTEGLPMSILEAMSAGKAIIGTKVGGIPSLVKENHNGWLLEVHKLEKLNEIFKEILKDEDILKKYGDNSYKDSKKYHSKNIIKKLETIYSEM